MSDLAPRKIQNRLIGFRVKVFATGGIMEGNLSGFSHAHVIVKIGDRIHTVYYEDILAVELSSMKDLEPP